MNRTVIQDLQYIIYTYKIYFIGTVRNYIFMHAQNYIQEEANTLTLKALITTEEDDIFFYFSKKTRPDI